MRRSVAVLGLLAACGGSARGRPARVEPEAPKPESLPEAAAPAPAPAPASSAASPVCDALSESESICRTGDRVVVRRRYRGGSETDVVTVSTGALLDLRDGVAILEGSCASPGERPDPGAVCQLSATTRPRTRPIPRALAPSERHPLGVVRLSTDRLVATNGTVFAVVYRDGQSDVIELEPQLARDEVLPRRGDCEPWWIGERLHRTRQNRLLLTLERTCAGGSRRMRLDLELRVGAPGLGPANTRWVLIGQYRVP